MFLWVELDFFCLECNVVSSNELWDVNGFGVTLDSLYIEAQGYVPVLLENLRGMFCSGASWPLGCHQILLKTWKVPQVQSVSLQRHWHATDYATRESSSPHNFTATSQGNSTFTRLLCAWDSLGKNTGIGFHALLQGIFPTHLLQGIFPTHGWKPGLLQCRKSLLRPFFKTPWHGSCARKQIEPPLVIQTYSWGPLALSNHKPPLFSYQLVYLFIWSIGLPKKFIQIFLYDENTEWTFWPTRYVLLTVMMAFSGSTVVKNPPADSGTKETRVWSLG